MNFRKNMNDTSPGFQMSPMLDIVFITLIHFMAATLFAKWENKLDITVPTADSEVSYGRQRLEIIVNIDSYNSVTEKIRSAMELAADLSVYNIVEAAELGDKTDFSRCYDNWRTRSRLDVGPYSVPFATPEANQVLKVLREIGEAVLIQLMVPGRRLGELHRRILREILLKVDYTQVCTNGILPLLAAYWRARRAGVDFEAEP